jgi:type II secretory pathway pseudopilin PulG
MKHRSHKSRSAAVLVVALVCLLVALSIATTMVTESIARRVQLHVELNARQAELLVQAGQGRAAARLAADDDYAGESWTPAVSDSKAAVVTITVETIDEEAANDRPTNDRATRVTVVASYPKGDPKAVRRSRVFLFTNTNLSPEE